jgi:hypothetical protein
MSIDIKKIKPLVLENIRNQGVVFLSDDKVSIKNFKKNCPQLFTEIEILDDKTKGLYKILENENLYDIIVTDFKSGYNIKRIMPHKKVIVVDYKENFDFKYISVDAFVSKPIEKTEFYNAIYSLTSVVSDEKELKYYIKSLEDEILDLNCKICKSLNKDFDDIKNLKDEVSSLLTTNCSFGHNSTTCGIEGKTEEKLKIENDKYENHSIRFTIDDDKKIDAEEFVVELNDMDFERVDILKEHLGELTIVLSNAYSQKSKKLYAQKEYIVSVFNELYQNVNRFYMFEVLAITFKDFASFINNLTLEDLQKAENKYLFLDSLISLIDDLIDWIDVIFFLKSTDNIHYLDASFASNCIQIEEMFKDEVLLEEDDSDDLEFF